jgi:hypothetical protein
MASVNDRYVNLRTKTLDDGRVVYASARPATVYADPFTDAVLYANDADRMDTIANNVYGSPDSWWKIAAANKQVHGSLTLKVGTKLLIPKVE